ncbi:hypothetical protein [Lactobacillus paragasseri]|uniref:DUF308 domain-containing protein n=1 Tax=Lactobacillus paragasseri TaxID=2107999 RepID=A0ABD5A2I4_9LACO|nr:hypothetical protein [Lactobacillus paragasseri]MDK7953046.1 hypothetical protein [Lactobacillus paragasseri]MDO6362078.1 hypothetical protein [Lactobacillus paragasseri]MDX5060409.1 hypothetical protein [Lactobacillus paragasseri]
MNPHPSWEQRHRKAVNFMKMLQYVIVALMGPLLVGNLRLFITCFGVSVIIYYSIDVYQSFLEAGLGNKPLLIAYSIFSALILFSSIIASFFSAYGIPIAIGSLTVGFLCFKTYRITILGLIDKNISLIVSFFLIVIFTLLSVAIFFFNQILFYSVVYIVCAFYWVYYWTVRLIMEKRSIRKDDVE